MAQKNPINEAEDNSILSEILTISNKLFKHKKIIEENFKKAEQLILNIQNEIHYLNIGLPSQPIKTLQEVISINNINSQAINSILELRDKRIVVCGESKDISIFSINYEQKEWKLDIKLENAHQDEIYDICEINDKILVSCSNDNTIKIWKIKQNNTLLLKSTLNNHTGYVAKVILLSLGKFASCSSDNSVKIWSCDEPFTKIISLSSEGRITNIMKPQKKEILLASNFVKKELEVWELHDYQKLNSIHGVYTCCNSQGMIELPNYRVAISSRSEGNPIVIIDINNYNIEKHIIEQGLVTGESSLCLLDSRSFLYVLNGKVIQISINNGYNIIYKSSNYKKLFGYGEMINITVTEGYSRYLIVTNKSKGINVMKPIY